MTLVGKEFKFFFLKLDIYNVFFRSQFRIPITKDTSSYLLRSPIRRQDVRGFRTKKEIIQQQKAAENRRPPMLRHYVYAGVVSKC